MATGLFGDSPHPNPQAKTILATPDRDAQRLLCVNMGMKSFNTWVMDWIGCRVREMVPLVKLVGPSDPCTPPCVSRFQICGSPNEFHVSVHGKNLW